MMVKLVGYVIALVSPLIFGGIAGSMSGHKQLTGGYRMLLLGESQSPGSRDAQPRVEILDGGRGLSVNNSQTPVLFLYSGSCTDLEQVEGTIVFPGDDDDIGVVTAVTLRNDGVPSSFYLLFWSNHNSKDASLARLQLVKVSVGPSATANDVGIALLSLSNWNKDAPSSDVVSIEVLWDDRGERYRFRHGKQYRVVLEIERVVDRRLTPPSYARVSLSIATESDSIANVVILDDQPLPVGNVGSGIYMFSQPFKWTLLCDADQ